jgi:hypothetical protein
MYSLYAILLVQIIRLLYMPLHTEVQLRLLQGRRRGEWSRVGGGALANTRKGQGEHTAYSTHHTFIFVSTILSELSARLTSSISWLLSAGV